MRCSEAHFTFCCHTMNTSGLVYKRGVNVFCSLLIAVAVSIDSLGVVLAYGLRKIYVPSTAYLIICFCTAVLMSISMLGGTFIRALLPYHAESLGGAILLIIGLWQLHQGWQGYLNFVTTEDPEDATVLRFRLPSLGVIVQIVRDPLKADFNSSGTIDFKESLALGAALGMDAFGAGLGAAAAGHSFLLVPVVSLACAVFVFTGFLLGRKSSANWFGYKGFVLPGLILMVVGALKI